MKLADSLEKRTTALTVSDAAEVLNVSVRQVYSLVASSRIPHIKIGGAIRFDPSEIAAWLRQRTIMTVVTSSGRNQDQRQAALRRFSPPATRNSESYPQVESQSRVSSRRSARSKKRTVPQQQYRLSFEHTGAPPLNNTAKVKPPSAVQ
jgi:excisionase family DNA binding protein